MQEKEVINYKVSRQLKEAIGRLEKIVSEKNYQVIETQDILRAILDVPDTGLSYALGYHAFTKSRVLQELEKATLVEKRSYFDEVSVENMSAHLMRKKRKEHAISSPVEIIKENQTEYYLKGCEMFPISKFVKDIFDFAEEMRLQNSPDGVIDTYWLLVGISQYMETNAHHIIHKLNLIYSDIIYNNDSLTNIFTSTRYVSKIFKDGRAEQERKEKSIQDSKIYNKLNNPDYSLLNDIAKDLTKAAKNEELMDVIGRDEEIRNIEIALTRRDKNNVALLGDGGVGKSALVEGLANKIARGETNSLKDKKILQFSINDLLSKLEGSLDTAILRFIDEMKREKNIILFVDEIHMLISHKKLMDAFKPVMARGDFRIIGATTPLEWDMAIKYDRALERRFEKILVNEPSIDDTIKILGKVAPIYENFHKVNFEKNIIELAVRLSKKYLKNEKLPDSALTVIDNAGAMVRIEAKQGVEIQLDYQKEITKIKEELKIAQSIEYNEAEIESIRKKIDELVAEFGKIRNNTTSNKYPLKISPEIIKKVVEIKSGITVKESDMLLGKALEKYELKKFSNLKAALATKVIGQTEATDIVAEAIIRSKVGFRNKNRPIGVFLFLGTSGVGKTETAKILSEEISGSSESLIRVDMSEFQQEHEVAKLIGAPTGYVGFHRGGILTNAVKEQPNAVILFDEVEKAHPKIYDIMLQLFDDGRLTDSKGETVDFTNTIIILTSNLGIEAIRKDKNVGFNRQLSLESTERLVKEKTMTAVKSFFRPELVNRIDEIVTFKPFSESTYYCIARVMLDAVVKMSEEENYHLAFTREAVEYIAKISYDPLNGARPIRQWITKLVENKISELLIRGEIDKGDKIKIDVNDSELIYEIIKSK